MSNDTFEATFDFSSGVPRCADCGKPGDADHTRRIERRQSGKFLAVTVLLCANCFDRQWESITQSRRMTPQQQRVVSETLGRSIPGDIFKQRDEV